MTQNRRRALGLALTQHNTHSYTCKPSFILLVETQMRNFCPFLLNLKPGENAMEFPFSLEIYFFNAFTILAISLTTTSQVIY